MSQNTVQSETFESAETNTHPERYLAALDIGSNSFHYVYARLSKNNLQILHTEKYQVKLASGLDEHDVLSEEAIIRGVASLENLLSSTKNLSADNFRVVATYTLRQAKNANAFLQAAKQVFPFDIEIISGHEEARLIYQGVAQNSDSNVQQLIVDIGGGSTECVIGQQFNVTTVASLNVGCVSLQKTFFPDEIINNKRFNQAIKEAKYQLESIVSRFKKKGWQQAVGTSGTIKTIYHIINAHEGINKPITRQQLQQLKTTLIKTASSKKIKLTGLKENRRDILCSGVAILIALLDMLAIKSLDYSSQALREGVLFEQLDAIRFDDIRQRTVNSLNTRFTIDQIQADNVCQLALAFFHNISKKINISSPNYRLLLQWAAKIHELGVDINPSGYHKHGEYILNHADLAGFNQEQQQALAWLVGNQRKKIMPAEKLDWYLLDVKMLSVLMIILRLSVLLNQQRQLNERPPVELSYQKSTIELTCPKNWLIERPLVDTDLFHEQQYLAKIAVKLTIKTTQSQ